MSRSSVSPSIKNMNNTDVLCSISEKITQLSDLKSTLNDILDLLRNITQCHHLAIRIVDPKGNIPFYAHLGLEKEFLESEHWVTLKDCLCGYVAKGNVNPSLPFFTEFGSFFTNSMSQLNTEIEKYEKKLNGCTLRNVCFNRGYESVAIIPLKIQGKIIADLYLSDKRKDLFPKAQIEFLEKLSGQIGIAIQNSQLYSSLEESQKKLMDLFDSASLGIVELDTKGIIVQVNQKGANLLGYSSSSKLIDNAIKMGDLPFQKGTWDDFLENVDKEGSEKNHVLSLWISLILNILDPTPWFFEHKL